MSTLYELIPAYKGIMEEIENNPEEAEKYLDTLDSVNCAIEVKADGYCKMMKMLDDTKGMEDEVARLQRRIKSQKTLSRSLKERLHYAMEAMGKDRVKTDLFTISIQNHKPSVDVHDPSLLPKEYKRITITEDYDKNAIYKAIQSGEVIPGACLMTSRGVVIR